MKKLSLWQLLSIQIGGAICLPVILIGQTLSQTYGLIPALGMIWCGNGILLFYAIASAQMGMKSQLSTIELAVNRFGRYGTVLFSLIFLISMIGWFAIQLNVITETVVFVFPFLTKIGTTLLLGVVMTMTAARGIQLLSYFSQWITPLLIATLVMALTTAHSRTTFFGAPASLAGLSLVIATGIGGALDLPTYWKDARTKREGIGAVILLFGLAIPLIECVGVYLGSHLINGSFLDLLTQGGGPLWTLWVTLFLFLATWMTNNTNLYSAGVNSFALFPRLSSGQRTILIGLVGTFFASLNILAHFALALEIMGLMIASLGAVLVSSSFQKETSFVWNTLSCGVGIGSGFVSLLGYLSFPLLDAFLGALVMQFMRIPYATVIYSAPLEIGNLNGIESCQKSMIEKRGSIGKYSPPFRSAILGALNPFKSQFQAARSIKLDDLAPLARGAAILGSGGGGDPTYDLLIAEHQIETWGPVPLLDIHELNENHLVVPLALIGAPLIGLERIASGKEFLSILEAIKRKFSNQSLVLMPAEIGGANALAPLYVAGRLSLPILDGDTIGRAFPEIPMSVCHLLNVSPTPAFLGGPLGKVTEISTGDASSMEKEARELTVRFGSSAAIGCYLMDAKRAKEVIIRGSLSRAIALGKHWFGPQEEVLDSGMIVEIEQEIHNGFLDGKVVLDSGTTLFYRNEYLLAKRGSQKWGVTPEILVLLEQESRRPITSESLRYGLRVDLFSLSPPEIWKSPKGMQLVGEEVLCSQWE